MPATLARPDAPTRVAAAIGAPGPAPFPMGSARVPAAGFDVTAGGDPIPALWRGAFAAFALLLIALGA